MASSGGFSVSERSPFQKEGRGESMMVAQDAGRSRWSAARWVGLGLAIGLMPAGLVVLRPQVQQVQVVHAMTALADDSFAVCTAPMSGGLGGGTEGFFILDFLTGDLSGGVLNPATSSFAATYRHNVLEDLGFQPGQAKNPRFLLTAGLADLRRGRGAPMAPSVLYVTDSSTGTTVAYAIPFSPQQAAAASAVPTPLVRLDVARPRGGGPQP